MANLSAESISQIEEILLYFIETFPDQEDDTEFRQTGNLGNQWRWYMTQDLKAVEAMTGIPGYEAVPIMQRVLNARGLSLTVLGYESEEEAINDLEPLWDKVKLATGEAPLQAAARMAEARPFRFKTQRLSPAYQRLLNISYNLQVMLGEDECIALPVEPLSKLLRISKVRTGDFRKYGIEDGYLQPHAKAFWNSNGKGRAATFYFFARWAEDCFVPSSKNEKKGVTD